MTQAPWKVKEIDFPRRFFRPSDDISAGEQTISYLLYLNDLTVLRRTDLARGVAEEALKYPLIYCKTCQKLQYLFPFEPHILNPIADLVWS